MPADAAAQDLVVDATTDAPAPVSATPRCPICAGHETKRFLAQRDVPVLVGVLWDDAASARDCPRGDIDLVFCRGCGFVWNDAFQQSRIDYTEAYNNSLFFSPTFRDYSADLVDRLVRTYDLHDKDVVDIGGGEGDFLRLLVAAGNNRGLGYDPTHVTDAADEAAEIEWRQEYFGLGDEAELTADLVVSRFVFEHIEDPLGFLRTVREAIRRPSRTVLYFEVPNLDLIVRQGSVWDVIYEHVNYFGREALAEAFARSGFEILDVREPYQAQFLTIEARVAPTDAGETRAPGAEPILDGRRGRSDLEALDRDVEAFRTSITTKVETWRERLARWRGEGVRVVAWGAGAKAVGFFNLTGAGDAIASVVDVNPAKHGKHLPGTGHEVVPPGALVASPPDVVVLMNPIYRQEIAQTLAELNLSAELVNV